MDRTGGHILLDQCLSLVLWKKASLIFFLLLLLVNNYKYFAQMVFTWLPKTLSIPIVSNLKTMVTNTSNFKVDISRY